MDPLPNPGSFEADRAPDGLAGLDNCVWAAMAALARASFPRTGTASMRRSLTSWVTLGTLFGLMGTMYGVFPFSISPSVGVRTLGTTPFAETEVRRVSKNMKLRCKLGASFHGSLESGDTRIRLSTL